MRLTFSRGDARGRLRTRDLQAFETYPLLRERVTQHGSTGLTGCWWQVRATSSVAAALENLPIRTIALPVERRRRLTIQPVSAAPDLCQLVAIRDARIPVASQCIRRMQPGAVLVDCVPIPHLTLRAWLGLTPSALELAQLGHDITAHWLARGIYDLEQWMCAEQACLLTFGRARPGAC